MSSNLDAWVRNMNQLANEMSRTPAQVVRAAARPYITSIRAEIAANTQGSRLRGVGKWNGGSRVGARVGITTSVQDSGSAASEIIQATGPLHLLERDTKGGYTIPRTLSSRAAKTVSGRRSKSRVTTGRTLSGRKLLNIGGNVVTGPVVRKRGTKGKHVFQKGVDRAERDQLVATATAFFNAVSQVIKS